MKNPIGKNPRECAIKHEKRLASMRELRLDRETRYFKTFFLKTFFHRRLYDDQANASFLLSRLTLLHLKDVK
ncbi:MAG: hypothetical protein B7Y25_05950 [Alphaproteobacteria bacterium 16-39-46]|nr:MAG: hypothetical protein B7Y25_05950 [Alphaproteobacteria bacterium 16-39-46]OZA42443.1 MAG: hypothetical protein B7X84_06020 [Alphaproteobacteria bacterium 17-39-52]